jgi:hypothetical protein
MKTMNQNRNCFKKGVRESMHPLARPIQWLLTWVTGKPLHLNERRLLLPTGLDVILTPGLLILAFIALFYLVLDSSLKAIPLILMLWLVIVGFLRKIQVTHLHHAIHNRLFNRPALNQFYAYLMPSLILVQNATEYRKEHLKHHNLNFFTTKHDADAAFLAQLSFIPGRSRSELWLNLWITIFSPVFHFLFLRARLSSLLVRGKPVATVSTLIMLGMHGMLISKYGWIAYVLAIAVPMFLLYHISALLQFLTEHAWNIAGSSVKNWAEYSERCWGRFCGEPYPQCISDSLGGRLRHMIHVMYWMFKMICVHLPVRISCLVSDLPVHDWHHLAHVSGQNPRDWQDSLYLRELAITQGDCAGFGSRELWGMRSMIEHQFLWLENIACHYVVPDRSDSGNTTPHNVVISLHEGKSA